MTIIEPNIKIAAPVRKASFRAMRDGQPWMIATVNKLNVFISAGQFDGFRVAHDEVTTAIALLEHCRDEIVNQEAERGKWAQKRVLELVEADAA